MKEERKLNIPLVGMVDTNCDPEEVDYVIPSNDDAIRAIKLITTAIADAVIEGNQGVSHEEGSEETSDKDFFDNLFESEETTEESTEESAE